MVPVGVGDGDDCVYLVANAFSHWHVSQSFSTGLRREGVGPAVVAGQGIALQTR